MYQQCMYQERCRRERERERRQCETVEKRGREREKGTRYRETGESNFMAKSTLNIITFSLFLFLSSGVYFNNWKYFSSSVNNTLKCLSPDLKRKLRERNRVIRLEQHLSEC